MPDDGRRNSNWQAKVKALLAAGYGVEDIALHLKCSADSVRREVQILRDAKELAKMYGGKK